MDLEALAKETRKSAAPTPAIAAQTHIIPSEVRKSLAKHMLTDGFDIVLDLKRSEGVYLYDSLTKRRLLDFFTFFASSPIGVNHPKMMTDEFKDRIFEAAVNKPSNSDVYTTQMAEFVDTFSRVAIPDYLPYAFFISGGALAVENALKTAFDWKVQKNFEKGYTEERGYKVLHFEQAFHGRTGYTMSLTNTDPTKIRYFPKFQEWPRIVNPKAVFPLVGANLENTIRLEQEAVREIKAAFERNKDEIAAMIIEPIQGEGGDNHFRVEFMQELRRLADEHEALLIFDEVQTGIGSTGKMWAHEHFVKPDILAFGKKTQVCGILAGKRVDEIPGNVFHVSSRINSTWGGNLTDMVRSQRYLEIIEEEQLVEHAAKEGEFLLGRIHELEEEFAELSNGRGIGLFCAIDLETPELRNTVVRNAFQNGAVILGCGERSIRFRPPLNIAREDIEDGISILRRSIKSAIH